MSRSFDFATTIIIASVCLLLSHVSHAFSKQCRSDSDCDVTESCIQRNLEKQNGKRFCIKPDAVKATLRLDYQNAEAKGAPVRRAAKGVLASRIVLLSGVLIGGGFAVAALIDAADRGLSGQGEVHTTLYLSGITAAFGLIGVAPLISNVSMQLRQNAYRATGYDPVSKAAWASWTMGVVGLAFLGTAVSLYFTAPEDHEWAWSFSAPALICSIAVDTLRLYWNRQLVHSVPRTESNRARLYPVIGSNLQKSNRYSGLSLGLGGTF